MLRIQVQNVAAAARHYFVSGLSSDDYYQAGTELPGQWLGLGSERLGLEGAVAYRDFADLTENIRPGSAERLTPRKDLDRRVGYDMSFHAPKSVSVAYFMTGDEAIREAFVASVRETMADIEAQMSVRVRRGGANHDRNTGNMVWAEYIHFTARPVDGVADPHLHAHNFVFNCTWDQEEQRWKAGQFGDIVRNAPYHQDAFHARLSQKLGDLGYAITPTEFAFELGPVPDGLVERFSRRTRLIESIAEEMGIADAAEKAGLGAKTRERKRDDISLDALRTIWTQRLTPEDRAWLQELAKARAAGQAFGATPESPDPDLAEPRPDRPVASESPRDGPDSHARPEDNGRRGPESEGRPSGGRPAEAGRPGRGREDAADSHGRQRRAEGPGRQQGQAQSQEQGHGNAREQGRGPETNGPDGEGARHRSRQRGSAAGSGSSAKSGETRMGASPREEEEDMVSSKPKESHRPSYSAKRAVDIAIRHLMDRESVVEEQRVIRYAMRHSRGRATTKQLWAALDERKDIPRTTIKDKKYITTREATRQERRMIQFAMEGRGAHRRLGGLPLSLSVFKLTKYDIEVMKTLLASKDRVSLLKMTGSSYRPEVVKATLAGIRQDMHAVVVVGANAAASRHAESMYSLKDVPTLGKFLNEPGFGKVARGKLLEHVIWVEQAGRIGTKDMDRLFELARKMKARVVLSGDEDGLQASQRGDAFGILNKHANLRSVEWQVNQGMEGEFAEAKESIRERCHNLGKEFVRNGMFRQTPAGAFVQDEAAKRYMEVSKKNRSAVLVGTTRGMVKWLNRAVRVQLRAVGKLKGGDISVLQLLPTPWSDTEKRLASSYRRGMVVEFHRNTPGFKPGDRTKVVGVFRGRVWLRRREGFGKPVKLVMRHADRFTVYEADRTSVSIGDRIELTRNVKPLYGRPLRNRSQRKIIGIVPLSRDLILDNGRILPRNFGHFQHAYATSAHGLHGRSVDSVIFAAIYREWRGITNLHLTSASEAANKRFEIFTDANPSDFEGAVLRTQNRMSATDFHFEADDINEKFEREQKATKMQDDFEEQLDREARKADRKASGRYDEFWEEVRRAEQEEREEEMEKLRQQEHERRQDQSEGHSHGL